MGVQSIYIWVCSIPDIVRLYLDVKIKGVNMCGEEEFDCILMRDPRTGYRIQEEADAPFVRCCDNCALILIPNYDRNIKKCIIAPVTEDPVINPAAVCDKHATPQEHHDFFVGMKPALDELFGEIKPEPDPETDSVIDGIAAEIVDGMEPIIASSLDKIERAKAERQTILFDAIVEHGNTEGIKAQCNDAYMFLILALKIMSPEQRDEFFDRDDVKEFRRQSASLTSI